MTQQNAGKKVAIVTGGASGIGRALCLELAKEDVFVVVADINVNEGQQVAAEIGQHGRQGRFERLNVTSQGEVEGLIYSIYNEFRRLDYVFNNAGIAMYGELYDMTLEHWQKIMDINLWGVIYGTQAAYEIMKEQGFGTIVNTSKQKSMASMSVHCAQPL